jgi:hypothetical protein
MRGLWVFWVLLAGAAQAADSNVGEIVRRSVAQTDADWNAAPQFNFTEQDVITKSGATTTRKYHVFMIDGSPYNELIAMNHEPLSKSRQAVEARKLEREIKRRQAETPDERAKRVTEYQNERRQDHALMREMANAFQYRMLGQETVNGRTCFVLEATPKPGYQPTSRETKVLTGMRGKLWIDTKEYQWVKVHAEVFRPVAFGLFIANVQPGTEFTLEQAPVAAGVWLPTHFDTHVRATVLYFWSHNSDEDDTFTNYQRQSGPPQTARK